MKRILLWCAVLWCVAGRLPGQQTLSLAAQEDFLRSAQVTKIRAASKGVTGSLRATLTAGGVTHDAHIQTIDVFAPQYRTDRGLELNFRDCYKFNVAAYLLDKMLGLGMVPVSVERLVRDRRASVSWWIDDVIGDETERRKKRLVPPDVAAFNNQMHAARVFTQLVYNTDANEGNFLTDKNWNLWMVDFTRAFRWYSVLRDPGDLLRCDRKILAALRALTLEALDRELSPYLTPTEIKALLARRDAIIKLFDSRIAERGEAAVLFDLPRAR